MKFLIVLAVAVAAVIAVRYFADNDKTPVIESNQVVLNRNNDSYGGTIEIYDNIGASKNVKEIDLSNRGLTGSLKAEIRMLTDLEVLDLSGNSFTGLPAEVGQLSKLRVLDLSSNSLTGLPHELGNLKNLQRLDLTGNSYSEFDLDIIRQGLPGNVDVVVD